MYTLTINTTLDFETEGEMEIIADAINAAAGKQIVMERRNIEILFDSKGVAQGCKESVITAETAEK